MERPNLLVSSVVRGSKQGDSHGGLFLVDMSSRRVEQVLDWNTGAISFEGRGADRGLRGIAVLDDEIYVAASDEIYVLDRRFNIVRSARNPYLNHCHELWPYNGALYMASTGFDCVLKFDLRTQIFETGVHLASGPGGNRAIWFDPKTSAGPRPSAAFHINNVFVDDSGLYISGRKMNVLIRLRGMSLGVAAGLPIGTHNARPYDGGILFNDTNSDRVVFQKGDATIAMPVPRYPEDQLISTGEDESGLARQAFGRGLCVLAPGLIAAGSSPTTVSIFDLKSASLVDHINISMDVRNAAHGLAPWR